jgi:D-proline reductase (dithiol) PrdB
MCHQSVGLIQSVIEKAGIPTASVTLLREVTERVDPPRTLFVDLPFGYPLGAANDLSLQTVIITAMFALLKEHIPLAVRWDFKAAG